MHSKQTTAQAHDTEATPPNREGTQKRRGRKPRADGAGAGVNTREALIRCGTEVLTIQGFHATGIEGVLTRVGVPKGSFYHYFQSKEAFVEAVIDNYASYFAKKLDRLWTDAQVSPLVRLQAFIDDATHAMERFQFQRGCLIGNLGQELASMNDVLRARLEAVMQSWQQRLSILLEQAHAAGEIGSDLDVQAQAAYFWIGWEGAILRSKLTKNSGPLRLFAAHYIDQLTARARQPSDSAGGAVRTVTKN